jgi:hypothetical protein
LPRKNILLKFGITDRPDLRVQVLAEQGGLSLDVHGSEDPVKSITPQQATDLSVLLCDAGEEALGQEIATAAAKAREVDRSRTP